MGKKVNETLWDVTVEMIMLSAEEITGAIDTTNWDKITVWERQTHS